MSTTDVQVSQEQAQQSAQEQQMPQLPRHKVKVKKALQRACNEKDDKGKMCGGHLKRWFYAVDSVEQACGDVESTYGKETEIYRCEYCKTLYLPNADDPKQNVAGRGRISVFGLTVPAKESK